MKLSIVTITISKEKQLPAFLASLKSIADELVVFVDDATTDNSLAVARSFTDKAYLIPHSKKGTYEVRSQDIVKACTGDWILIVADDETLSPEWTPNYISKLLENQYVTHYWIPRCWMIPPGDQFISTAPWYPDYQMRLFRNIPSLLTFPGIIHESILIAGEAHYLADAYIYHWDLIWNTREKREQKVARYKQLNPENPNEELYLYEDYYFETSQEISLRSPLPREPHDLPLPKLGKPWIDIKALNLPNEMTVDTGYVVTLSIHNSTDNILHTTHRSGEKTDFHLTYHWLNQEEGQIKVYQWKNPLLELPVRMMPGETASCLLPINTVSEEGHYLLYIDLLEKGVSWFSQLNSPPPQLFKVKINRLPKEAEKKRAYLSSRMEELPVTQLKVEITSPLRELQLQVDEKIRLPVIVHNQSTKAFSSLPPYPINASYHWLTVQGTAEVYEGSRTRFSTPLLPGEKRKVRLMVEAPRREGAYTLQITLVQEHCFWFEQVLNHFTINLPVTVTKEQKRKTLVLCRNALKSGRLIEVIQHYKKEQELLDNEFNEDDIVSCKVASVKQHCQKNALPYYKLEAAKPYQVRIPYTLNQKNSLDYVGRVNIPEIYLAEVTEAVVIGGHWPVLVNNNALALFDDYLHPEKNRYDYNLPGFLIKEFTDRALLWEFDKNPGAPIERGILLCGPATSNYFHWLIEFLPRFWAIDQFIEYRDWPLIIDDKLPANLLEALQLFNHHNRPLLPIQYGVRHWVKRLVIPSKLGFLPMNYKKGIQASYKDISISSTAINFLRQRCEVDNKVSQVHTKKRLYLSRKSPSYRRLVNDEEVENLFKEYGFEIIAPEKLSFLEQVELLASAEIVAGPTGAAMTNLIFAPKTATVILLTVERVLYFFSTLADLVGQKMIHIHGKTVGWEHAIELQNDYAIDLQEVKRVLDYVVFKL